MLGKNSGKALEHTARRNVVKEKKNWIIQNQFALTRRSGEKTNSDSNGARPAANALTARSSEYSPDGPVRRNTLHTGGSAQLNGRSGEGSQDGPVRRRVITPRPKITQKRRRKTPLTGRSGE